MGPEAISLDHRSQADDRRLRYTTLHGASYPVLFEILTDSLARIDWNRDGREDLVVGHLYDATAMLTNTTTDGGSHLSLRLIGVQSNRDAIGTTIQARIGARMITRQLTAGDGYQCSNERRLNFGTGHVRQIDELTVRWPSGLTQRFDNVAVPAEMALREGNKPIVETSAHCK